MEYENEEIRSLTYKNKRLLGCLRRLKAYYLGEDFKTPLNQTDEALTITENIMKLYPVENFIVFDKCYSERSEEKIYDKK